MQQERKSAPFDNPMCAQCEHEVLPGRNVIFYNLPLEKRVTYFDLNKASVDVTRLIGERFNETRRLAVVDLPANIAEGFDPSQSVIVSPDLVRGGLGVVFEQW